MEKYPQFLIEASKFSVQWPHGKWSKPVIIMVYQINTLVKAIGAFKKYVTTFSKHVTL